MNKLLLVAAISAAFACGHARAEDAAPAVVAKPDNETSFNAAVVSDYRYRGISQTRLKPALQGGFDYVNNPTGLYAGVWMSTIKWTKDAGGDGDVEVDIYAGKRGQVGEAVSYDVGVLTYVYPSNDLKNVRGFVNADTTEIYGQLGYGPAYIKYSHAVTNLFGFVDSKNSGYVDIGANLDAGDGFTVNLHAGHQKVKHNEASNYTDWKLGATKDFGVVTGALAVIGTNAGKTAYASPANGKFLGKTALQLTISKVF
ncbi:TorF family putative porin [Burkholderia sp. LMU1-1-1.1]|uniref:TorF family putative porin n=1 Tax=Burkholderia sp. LMU1-1-1.1 TaxID=3135266 RepID=UPI00344476C9